MRNPFAVIVPDTPPAPRGHPLRFGKVASVHTSRVYAAGAKGRLPLSAFPIIRRLVVEARPGERIRIDHLQED